MVHRLCFFLKSYINKKHNMPKKLCPCSCRMSFHLLYASHFAITIVWKRWYLLNSLFIIMPLCVGCFFMKKTKQKKYFAIAAICSFCSIAGTYAICCTVSTSFCHCVQVIFSWKKEQNKSQKNWTCSCLKARLIKSWLNNILFYYNFVCFVFWSTATRNSWTFIVLMQYHLGQISW